MIHAIAYLRTSSATNVGADKDSDKRQRAAIAAFASAHNYELVGEFYDAAVSGTDPVTARPGFMAMLAAIKGNGARTIIVESPDRFARDLAVQIAGHDYLKAAGIALVPATAPDFFTQDTPTAVLIRQVLGAVAQFEKASMVAKLRAARERIKAKGLKCEGRPSYAQMVPRIVASAKQLKAQGLTLRQIAAVFRDKGYVTSKGRPYVWSAIRKMVVEKENTCIGCGKSIHGNVTIDQDHKTWHFKCWQKYDPPETSKGTQP